MYEITYVFKNGRRENYINNTIEARELYYGLPLIEDQANISVIEFNEELAKKRIFINKLDRLLSKFFSLPFYFSKILTKENFKVLKSSKNIILVNESVACSLLPFLVFLRLFNKKNVLIFVMGLYSKKINYKIFKPVHYLIIKLVEFTSDKIFFLGKGELAKANMPHKKNKKLVSFPFCVDTDFWTSNRKNIETENSIIFVGNDSNKDQEKLLNIAKALPEVKFKFISNLPLLKDIKIKNVEIIEGEWGNKYLSDEELKQQYMKSKISIIPLLESTQPSGQSVALQCMSLGVPVMISDTSGFWDKEEFLQYKNIIFIKDNSSENWVNKIKEVIDDEVLLGKISTNSKNLVKEKYNLDKFYNNLKLYLQ